MFDSETFKFNPTHAALFTAVEKAVVAAFGSQWATDTDLRARLQNEYDLICGLKGGKDFSAWFLGPKTDPIPLDPSRIQRFIDLGMTTPEPSKS